MHQVPKPHGRHAIFVDPTGRRRRLVRWAGIAAGGLLAAYLAVVAFGLVTGIGAPLTPWPDAKPSHREAAPRHSGPQLTPTPNRSSSRRPTARPAPSTTAPTTARSTTAPTHPATTVPATTHPAKGRGYGLTKSPNPKKP